jgi:3-oxoacyl-[acyl-carrier-protein] synthase III
VRPFPYLIAATSSLIGDVISTDEWVERAQIPHRSGQGYVDGALARKVLGVHGKSWSPELFRNPEVVSNTARLAMARAGLEARQVDAVILVTCTPYEIQLDQDSFRFLRALGVPDDVPPIQASAGCAGVARAAQIAAQLNAENVLVISYNLPSCYMVGPNGAINPLYQSNTQHPFRDILWTSPGIFSDGIGVLVLRRTSDSQGFVFYSRDSHDFGDAPGFVDPLVHYLGGGALRPPGFEGGAELACYGMHGEQVKKYYSKGMLLNHQLLRELRPGYENSVARLYTHQASPALVNDFLRRSELPLEKTPTNARELGNLVTPCTIKLLDDDLAAGAVLHHDDVCFSVVGAGPERGFLLTKVEAEWATRRGAAVRSDAPRFLEAAGARIGFSPQEA